MRIILNTQKKKIGKQLAAIYHIATESMGETRKEIKIENMAKIIENIADIAFDVGGEKFATEEVPAYVEALKNLTKEKKECSATTSASAPTKTVRAKPANATR